MAGVNGSLSALPLKCGHSAVFERASQPQNEIPNLFAPPDLLELAVQLFRHALRIALIVLVRILLLPLLQYMLQAWPDKYLHE